MAKKRPIIRVVPVRGRTFQLRYTDPSTKREVRISTGSHDPGVVDELKQELEAKLRLGIDTRPARTRSGGPTMSWEVFRERYSAEALHGLARRTKTIRSAESRLDLAERILMPRTLADVADGDALSDLQMKLLKGTESRKRKGGRLDEGRPRSKHTVKSHMAAVVAALNWAVSKQWLTAVPKFARIETAKLRHMKGRAIVCEEFEKLIASTPKVVGEAAAPSWIYLLRGAKESGLRLDELMHLSWDDPDEIMPVWEPGCEPVLSIPASRQKNDTEECIPMVPGLELLLEETPRAARMGWVFHPVSLQVKCKRNPRHGRPNAEWVGKIITRIGSKAGVIVQPAKNGKPAKYASAHDLRRMFADQLRKSGVAIADVALVCRHSSTETTRRYYAADDVQHTAKAIRKRLAEVLS